jgi:hypothetical protein
MTWWSDQTTLDLQEGDTSKYIWVLLSTMCFMTYSRHKVIIKAWELYFSIIDNMIIIIDGERERESIQ